MKKIRKFLASVMALVTLFTSVPISAFAYDVDVPSTLSVDVVKTTVAVELNCYFAPKQLSIDNATNSYKQVCSIYQYIDLTEADIEAGNVTKTVDITPILNKYKEEFNTDDLSGLTFDTSGLNKQDDEHQYSISGLVDIDDATITYNLISSDMKNIHDIELNLSAFGARENIEYIANYSYSLFSKKTADTIAGNSHLIDCIKGYLTFSEAELLSDSVSKTVDVTQLIERCKTYIDNDDLSGVDFESINDESFELYAGYTVWDCSVSYTLNTSSKTLTLDIISTFKECINNPSSNSSYKYGKYIGFIGKSIYAVTGVDQKYIPNIPVNRFTMPTINHIDNPGNLPVTP